MEHETAHASSRAAVWARPLAAVCEAAAVGAALVALCAARASGRLSYVLVHSLKETFAIAIAAGVFMFAWNSRRFMRDGFLLLLGIAYLFVAVLDLLHTEAYRGMGAFERGGTNLATQLWLCARYVESASLLAAPAFVGRRLRTVPAFAAYAAVTAILVAAVFGGVFPAGYVEGSGLTAFKIASEYAIMGVIAVAMVLLRRRRAAMDGRVFRLLFASMAVTIASEMAFTLYMHDYGLMSLAGHVLKVVSFYLIYKATIETGLLAPYEVLFRDLEASERALLRARDGLEREVEARTADLVAANERLRREGEEREALERKLHEAQKMEALGRLADGVAHDFGNILAAIVAQAEGIARSAGGPDDLAGRVEQVIRAAESGAALTRQLLAVSHAQRLAPGPVDLGAVVCEMAPMIRGLLGERIELVTEVEPGLPPGLADRVGLEQVIMNLAVNARDAMPSGGTLAIRAARAVSAEAGAHGAPAPRVTLEVSDTGCGMDAETRSRLFEPFFTTKRGGKGLGLAVVYGVVRRSGGEIAVRSAPGEGTTFTIALPGAERAEADAARPSSPPGAAAEAAGPAA